MALRRDLTYPSRFTAATAAQPQGAFKNRSAPEVLDGSYLEQQWLNDWSGFFSAMLDQAGITPNNTVDTALVSQYIDAANAFWAAERKNQLYNGDFLVNQRGNSFGTVGVAQYTSDGWQNLYSLDGGVLDSDNVDILAFTTGQTDVPNNPDQYFNWTHSITGGLGLESVYQAGMMENLRRFSGREVTLSFWIKGSVAGTARYAFSNEYGSGGSAVEFSLPADTDINVTTDWQKVTRTFNFPDLSGKIFGAGNHLRLLIIKQLGSTAASNFGGVGAFKFTGTLSIADVQVEFNSIATDFDRKPFEQQLQEAERYFQTETLRNGYAYFSQGSATTDSNITPRQFRTRMRVTPTAFFVDLVAPTARIYKTSNGNLVATNNILLFPLDNEQWSFDVQSVGVSADDGYMNVPNADTKVGFSAEY